MKLLPIALIIAIAIATLVATYILPALSAVAETLEVLL